MKKIFFPSLKFALLGSMLFSIYSFTVVPFADGTDTAEDSSSGGSSGCYVVTQIECADDTPENPSLLQTCYFTGHYGSPYSCNMIDCDQAKRGTRRCVLKAN